MNQLHALLRELVPGGVPRPLIAAPAAQLLPWVRLTSTADLVRREVACDLIAEVQHHDWLVEANTEQIRNMLTEHPTTPTEIVGMGPVLVARNLAGTGDPCCFPTAAPSPIKAVPHRFRWPVPTTATTGSPATTTGT